MEEKLSRVFHWIERNHTDGFVDSMPHDKQLDRIRDRDQDRISDLERDLAAVKQCAFEQQSQLAEEWNRIKEDADRLAETLDNIAKYPVLPVKRAERALADYRTKYPETPTK